MDQNVTVTGTCIAFPIQVVICEMLCKKQLSLWHTRHDLVNMQTCLDIQMLKGAENA